MALRVARVLGALTLLGVGAVHLQQYLDAGYEALPTIGTLFLINAIGAALVAGGLLAPVRRLLRGRGAELATGVLALAGVAIAAGSLIALFIAESQPLFGFQEFGYDTPVKLAIATEAATVLLLAPVAARELAQGLSRVRRPPGSRGALSPR
jgi:hypothetical protein